MKGLMDFLESKIVPFATKLGNNRYLKCVKDGLIASMPVMIVGSFTLVITEFPVTAYQNFMTSVFGANWKWFGDVASASTMGLTALIAVIAIAYNLGKSYNRDPMMSSVISLVSYFTLLIGIDGGFSSTDFGAKGLFVAIITAILSVNMFNFILSKNITIKMPDGVPPAVAKSFEALLPAAIIIPVFLVIRFVFSLTPWESARGFIFNFLQLPLMGISDSYFELLFQFVHLIHYGSSVFMVLQL